MDISTSYNLDPNFNQLAHVGLELIHVGVENKHYGLLESILLSHNLHILRATPVRYLQEGELFDWVDVECFGKRTGSEWSNFDALDMALNDTLTTAPYVLEILDFSRGAWTYKSLHTRTTNADRFTNPLQVLSETYTYKGIQPTYDMSPDTMHRVITIHPSKETPLVDSYLSTSMLKTRTAARYFLAPYAHEQHRLDCFTFGITGELLCDRLKSTDLLIDVISADVVNRLFTMTTEQQYHVGLLVTAFRRLYAGISGAIFSSIVTELHNYQNVVELILGAPGPSDQQLSDAFANRPDNDAPF